MSLEVPCWTNRNLIGYLEVLCRSLVTWPYTILSVSLISLNIFCWEIVYCMEFSMAHCRCTNGGLQKLRMEEITVLVRLKQLTGYLTAHLPNL